MSFVFPTNASQVQAFAGALYGIQVGTTTMAQVNADIAANGGLASTLNSYYSATFGGVATSTVAATVAANLGLTGDALASGTAYVEAQLNAVAAGARGAVISSIVNLFGTLSADATFGAAATAWNAKVAVAAAYTGAANVAVGTEVVASSVFTLTAGVDNVPGTAGNDTINAEDTTLTALDVINGGAGNDVMNLLDLNGGSILSTSATIASVETINVRSAGNVGGNNALDFSASNITGLTNLNVTQADDVWVKAAKTTAVSVTGATGDITIEGSASAVVSSAAADAATYVSSSGSVSVTHSKLGQGQIYIDGGTDVSVTAAAAHNSNGIVVGNTQQNNPALAADVPTGAVNINVASKATDGDASVYLPGITVEGGSSVTITQSVTAGADVATKSDTNYSVAQGNVAVTGTAKTTSVTVNQTAESDGAAAVSAVAGVKQVDTVTFVALAASETIEVGGLTFTASKALTAAEAAAAFANLSAGTTQGAAPASNGVYSGTFGDYSTGAVTTASGVSSVLATAKVAAAPANAITVDDTAAAGDVASVVKADGATATDAVTGELVIRVGSVVIDGTIDGTDVLTTVSLDAYGDNSTIESDALTKLTLANSISSISVSAAASTLELNLDNIISEEIEMDGADIETLIVNTTGTASEIDLEVNDVKSLTINAGVGLSIEDGEDLVDVLETVVVKGVGKVDLDDISGAFKLNSFSAADNTGGVTATIETEIDAAAITGAITEYVFSQGADVVTLSNNVIETKVTLGAGNDALTLADGTGTADVKANVYGGDGTDTLGVAAADAEILSANTLFEGKIDGFEKIKLGAAQVATTIDLANLDDISYVISAGGAAGVPGIPGVPGEMIIWLQLSGQSVSTSFEFVIKNVNYSVTVVNPTADASEFIQAVAQLLNADADFGALYEAAEAAGATPGILQITEKITTSIDGNFDVTDIKVGGANAVYVGGGTSNLYSAYPGVAGTPDGPPGTVTLTNMINAGTLELIDAAVTSTVTMDDATGTADSFNIVTKVDASNLDFGTVDVAGVETLNVTATDTTPVNTTTGAATISKATLTVTDAAVKAIVVTGNSDLDLTSAGAALTSVDASTATGKVSFSSAVNSAVVKGGSAADTLTATGNSQKLHGGAGADTLVVTGNLTELTGGAGADTFNIGDATTNVNSYATITDLAAGDKIKFSEGAANFAASKVVLANTAVFQDYANAAIAASSDGEVSWFQFAGDTYIIENVAIGGQLIPDNEVTFTNGSDIIVKITGLVDLSTASFSASADTLLIA